MDQFLFGVRVLAILESYVPGYIGSVCCPLRSVKYRRSIDFFPLSYDQRSLARIFALCEKPDFQPFLDAKTSNHQHYENDPNEGNDRVHVLCICV